MSPAGYRPPAEQPGGPLRRLRLPISTPRLLLRLPRPRDVPDLLAQLQDPRVSRWLLHVPYPYHRRDAMTWIRQAREAARAGTRLSLLVTRQQESGTAVGGISLSGIDWVHHHGILGYWIGRPYWNRGFASEAVGAICRAAFVSLRLHRIGAFVFDPNPASARVLQNAGFKFEGRAREAYFKNGQWVDDLEFGLLRGDGPAPTTHGGPVRSSRRRARAHRPGSSRTS